MAAFLFYRRLYYIIAIYQYFTSDMALFDDQIQRIKGKLFQARQVDKDLKVMGASSHKYQVNDPVAAEEVLKLEEKYGIDLPDCYKSFILQFGNAGIGYQDAAAGPYYGIYPLGENINELISDERGQYLKRDCIIYPGMSDQHWMSLQANIDNDEHISDEDIEKELGKIWGGIITIGSQGCSYVHGIIINGTYRGRVINICMDRQGPPKFTFENNFLDWYERWLDEVISGELMEDGSHWFGYAMGGTDAAIIIQFLEADSLQQKEDCLTGILSKRKLENSTIQIVEEQFLNGNDEFKMKLLQILVKFDYERARPYLVELARTDIGATCQFIYWYAKHKSPEWIPLIREYMGSIEDAEKFRFCTYVLVEAKTDFGDLIVPFTAKDDEEIRITAFYTLGELDNKSDFVDVFIRGLNDHSNRVIHTSLQALAHVHNRKLLKHYKRIAEKFPREKDYILANLNHRLAEYGLTNKTILKKDDFAE